MSWIDWCILVLPVIGIMWVAIYSRRYVRSVADFLSAGRIAGRYVLNVGDIANALSILGLVGYIEVQYRTGFAMTFWNYLLLPIGVIMGLSGFINYRWRETKAMSFGQFLEMRYGSRSLRFFASFLRSLAEMLTNMIMPAIAARFFIFFLDLPTTFMLFGIKMEMFPFLTVLFMALAITIICMGGTLALLITDALQGMLLYPLLAIFTIFVLSKFSWHEEIVPVMLDRVKGESFLNPFDIAKLRDFNLFMLIVNITASFLQRGSWIGHGASNAARTPHEAKMGGLLGGWSGAMNSVFYVVLATMIITMLNHRHFSSDAQQIRVDLCERAVAELDLSDELVQKVRTNVREMPAPEHIIGKDAPLGEDNNLDTVYLNKVHETLLDHAHANASELSTPQANNKFQQFRTLYNQLILSSSMRHILPIGLMGLFCLLLIMSMISTDDTRIYSACLTITQDCIIPFCKKGISPKQHIWIIRGVAIFIGIFFCIGAFLMSQLDFVQLYATLICIMWNGGAGAVVTFGLYGRFGTKQAAWASLISGMGLGIFSVFIQRCWADVVYPFLEAQNWVEGVGNFLTVCSKPFGTLVHWEMNPVKCPINAYELYFFTMIITTLIYLIVSWCTCKEPFNLDRMLHRGIYNIDGENKVREKWSIRTVFRKLLGITPEYTRGDKIIAYVYFGYQFVFIFCIAFLGVVIWNSIPGLQWPSEWWSYYFLVISLLIPGTIALISAFWFGIGGFRDIRRLFIDLNKRVVNHLDNGQVEGNVSLSEQEVFAKIEEQAHTENTPNAPEQESTADSKQ